MIFAYCISIVMFKNPTEVSFIRGGESAVGKSFGFTLMSLVAGWWGFPGARFAPSPP